MLKHEIWGMPKKDAVGSTHANWHVDPAGTPSQDEQVVTCGLSPCVLAGNWDSKHKQGMVLLQSVTEVSVVGQLGALTTMVPTTLWVAKWQSPWHGDTGVQDIEHVGPLGGIEKLRAPPCPPAAAFGASNVRGANGLDRVDARDTRLHMAITTPSTARMRASKTAPPTSTMRSGMLNGLGASLLSFCLLRLVYSCSDFSLSPQSVYPSWGLTN